MTFIEPFNVRAALWAILAERMQGLWQVPDDVFDWREWASPLHEWANPYLQVNAVWPGTYDIPPVPDEPPDLRTHYTPDDALPTDLLRYRTDTTRQVRV